MTAGGRRVVPPIVRMVGMAAELPGPFADAARVVLGEWRKVFATVEGPRGLAAHLHVSARTVRRLYARHGLAWSDALETLETAPASVPPHPFYAWCTCECCLVRRKAA